MLNAKVCTASGDSDLRLKDQLEDKCEKYVSEVKKQLNKFWDENVLNSAKEWKKYGEDAKAKLNSVQCK